MSHSHHIITKDHLAGGTTKTCSFAGADQDIGMWRKQFSDEMELQPNTLPPCHITILLKSLSTLRGMPLFFKDK